jgi:hypothetical protein
MAVASASSYKLSNLQLELLKLYPYDVSEEELRDIRRLLADYFAGKVDAEMARLWDERGWNQQTIEGWKGEHLRRTEP